MRFSRLTRMAHIVSLTLLMVAALPFVVSEAGFPHDDRNHFVDMDVRDCGAHLVAGDESLVCSGMMVHCVTFSGAGHTVAEPVFRAAYIYHRSRAVQADSIVPEASSPPPRI